MKIIFDFDGTLLDSSERLYRLFNTLIPQSQMTKEEYWELKRNKINHKLLLQQFFPEVDFDKFNKQWMQRIETEEFLSMDRLYADTAAVLEALSKEHTLYLLTARQSRELLLREMESLGIKHYFKEILTTENRKTKEQLLQEYGDTHPGFNDPNDYFVSDMGQDIVLGNRFGYQTVAIAHGFMCRERLQEYAPVYIIDELSELEQILS